jgi:hypothetical protein
MPTVLRIKGFKFWFYEADLDEPPHIHVAKAGKEGKFWLEPIDLARAGRFKPVELREIKRIIQDNHEFLINSWNTELSKRANR